jgi:hypothetical protein
MLNANNIGNRGKTASAVTAAQTTITLQSGQGALFAPGTGNHYWLTLRSDTAVERVRVTARTGDVLTVQARGMDGTTAYAWNAGTCVSVEWSPTQLCEFTTQCVAGAPVPVLTNPGNFCFDPCTCFTVDGAGRITSITKGTSC